MTWAYTLPDEEGVKIVLTPNRKLSDREVQSIIPANAVSSIEIVAELPTRDFRKTWELKDDIIQVNKEAARDIIREERNKTLLRLDLIAVSAERSRVPKDISEVALEAQRLRDIPQDPNFMSEDVEKLQELLKQAKEINTGE